MTKPNKSNTLNNPIKTNKPSDNNFKPTKDNLNLKLINSSLKITL